MRNIRVLMVLAVIIVMMVGCLKQTDEEQIQELLEDSQYIGQGVLRMVNDSTNNFQGSNSPYFLSDTFPADVHWLRWIETPISVLYSILVTGDSADATITTYFHGEPPGYGLFVMNELSGPIWEHAITDSAIRKIKLYNDGDGWHISSLTAADVYTVGSNPITITEITAEVESRDYTWTINSADDYYTKDELPTFLPADTILVTVTVSVTDDSCWSFLHHGAGHRPGFGLRRHYRDPFYRDSTYTFSRTWHIADDSVTYGVRHAAVDVLTWQALFGDSTATYNARAWAMPYIVKEPDQNLPPDIE